MKKIIGFFGGDSQVGTTMISQSVAECLKNCGRQVLFIKGSGKYGEEFMNGDGRYSLDDIKANIISGKVSYEDIDQVITEYKGISVIPSVRNPFTSKYYPENTYEVMLASVTDDFDYIVIDAGNDANLGLLISALNVSDCRYFVTTQQSKAIHRLTQMKKNIMQPLGFDAHLIINKYMRDPALFLKRDIENLCEMENASVVPYSEYGWQMEMEGRTLMHFHRFAKSIEKIVGDFEEIEKKEKTWKKSLA